MSNSKLVDCVVKSPNHSGRRTHSIDRITPHCVVGQLQAEVIGACFAPVARRASCNYGIGTDGRVVLCVDECNRSWCTSSNANDQRAITIECASDLKDPYAFNDTVYNKLIDLCVDICQRNGKKKVLWFANPTIALNYKPKEDELLLTVHRWFDKYKSCPGDWMFNRMGDLANKINKKLGNNFVQPPKPAIQSKLPYIVKITDPALNIRKGPEVDYPIVGCIKDLGRYTIVEESSDSKWGKLKSGIGWISLKDTIKT